MSCITAEDIDQLLPQTQCGLCGYGGCMPYAKALAEDQAAINLCPPGGITGLIAIADLLQKDPSPFLSDMEEKAKPRAYAVIREDECIGCTKCIQACPVDAILGAGKQMHTVITDECTGCELCVSPCPVDCIDIIPMQNPTLDIDIQQREHARRRFQAREQRLEKARTATTAGSTKPAEKKSYVEAALLRIKQKKNI